jgi:predicted metal-dependent enzyme (double-stranded beta helix superfamily)
MSYTLDDLCADTRQSLKSKPGHEGREEVRQHLERLLSDKEFLAEHCGPDAKVGKYRLYSDPELGFTVISFISAAGRTESPPHDHGESWAIYGQATLHTNMRDWEHGDAKTEGAPAELRPVKEYRLDPGQAELYDVGDIHSIHPADNCRYVRIAGTPEDVFNARGPAPT